MKKNITTLAEIEAEQQKLKVSMDLTQKEFTRSLDNSQTMLKSYLLKRVVIPAGAIGLGVATASKVFGSDKKKDSSNEFTKEANMLGQLLPFILNFMQSYWIRKQSEETIEMNQTEENEPVPMTEKELFA